MAATPIVSTFDVDLEGWTSCLNCSVPGAVITYESTGGNPGGWARFDNNYGDTYIGLAPQKFSGNLLSFDGGTISFDAKAIESLPPEIGSGFGRITIVGGGHSVMHDYAPYPTPPGQTWSTYSASLTASEFHTNQDVWEEVLANVTYIYVVLEPVGGASIGFDNFKLVPPQTPCPDDAMHPTGAVHAYPNVIWPPNNKMVTVRLDGYVMDELSIARDGGGIGVSSAYLLLNGTKITLRDETIDLIAQDGSFSVTARVKAKKGAVYNVELHAGDTKPATNGGPNSGIVDSTFICVPHDMGDSESGE
jgi:hypothetical protein